MRLNAINDYSSYLQNYRVPEIPSVSLEEVRRQDQQAAEGQSRPAAVPQPSAETTGPRRDAALEDISLGFQKDFGYIGKDSDILALDQEANASDTQKDQILQQYRFFVGSQSSSTLVDNADGLVVAKAF